MQEQRRLERNSTRVEECFGVFGQALDSVIADMERLGFRPRIQDAWRSPEAQLEAVTSGNSELKFGFHNVTGSEGTKEALAVDLLDDDAPLDPPRRYLIALAAVARDHGLETGLTWGLKRSTRERLEQAVRERDFDAPGKIGWDPCHVQVTGITPTEARGGRRPTSEDLRKAAVSEDQRVVRTPSTTRALLVRAVSGPARIRVGDTAVYNATRFNFTDPTPEEKATINWDIVSGDRTLEERRAAGATLELDITPELGDRTIRVRPFRNSPTDRVSVVTRVEAAPLPRPEAPGVGESASVGPRMIGVERDHSRYFARVDGGPRFFVASDVRFQSRRGLMNTRDETGKPYDPADYRSGFGFWADFIHPTALCESRGFFHRINTYDAARFTFGFFQHAAHTPNDNLVLLLREMLGLPQAAGYFPDLTIREGAIHRVTDRGFEQLETADSTQPLLRYLNPSGDVVDEIEAINAAKMIHWALNDTAHRALQVKFAVSQQKRKMAEYHRRYQLDGVADTVCLVIADIRHQGRARSRQIIEALESQNALEQLLRIGEDGFPERIRTLRGSIEKSVNEGILGTRRYRASANDFVLIQGEARTRGAGA